MILIQKLLIKGPDVFFGEGELPVLHPRLDRGETFLNGRSQFARIAIG